MGPKLVDHWLYESGDNCILWIRFNCPERLNALVGTVEENRTVAKVDEYMRSGDDDPNIRVIALTRVDPSFCAGANFDSNRGDAGGNFPGDRSVHGGLDGTRQHFFHGFTMVLTSNASPIAQHSPRFKGA
ncbi:hypothetical protein [Acidisphaera sp. S103]|uniref:hypothetical protein n=1 Tax=Acidisphaera sp. S103 TaxID=1747223 RepID=UPI00131E74A8|nr:hypothetical protein [Acidisphaera sp. S103]